MPAVSSHCGLSIMHPHCADAYLIRRLGHSLVTMHLTTDTSLSQTGQIRKKKKV